MAKTTMAEKAAALDRKNLEAARIILGKKDPSPLEVEWARLALMRLAPTQGGKPTRHNPAPEGKPYPD